jgi:hypothetical protein
LNYPEVFQPERVAPIYSPPPRFDQRDFPDANEAYIHNENNKTRSKKNSLKSVLSACFDSRMYSRR